MGKQGDQDRPLVIVSGGYDPPHVGHLRLIQTAARVSEVLVLLHSDAWLQQKKGYVFMPWDQRAEFLLGIKGVVGVRHAKDQENGGVEETLKEVRDEYPERCLIFANGGDRLVAPEPEAAVCQAEGILLAFNVGGPKVQASSMLVRAAVQHVSASSSQDAVSGTGSPGAAPEE